LLLTACQKDFGIPKKKQAQKNPSVIARIIEDARIGPDKMLAAAVPSAGRATEALQIPLLLCRAQYIPIPPSAPHRCARRAGQQAALPVQPRSERSVRHDCYSNAGVGW
jgi:hypothetical protein